MVGRRSGGEAVIVTGRVEETRRPRERVAAFPRICSEPPTIECSCVMIGSHVSLPSDLV
jgi:hypothetical protein